jgi:hydrogenase maturation protein HypF
MQNRDLTLVLSGDRCLANKTTIVTKDKLALSGATIETSGWTIRVRGTVQGVGFRPTVFKLAMDHSIDGLVLNDGDGVVIEAWTSETALLDFIQAIHDNAPPLARIEQIEYAPMGGDTSATVAEESNKDTQRRPKGFSIAPSIEGGARTDIAADAATCPACIEDVSCPSNRRFRYPFTNCTHCGPRLSIIKSIPYDRASTSMAVFKMCAQCRSEYDDPLDRRFHAQPNACPVCGPRVWLELSDGHAMSMEGRHLIDDIATAAELIRQGEIIAIKGIGGFHLACDATNEQAVSKLRLRKQRFHKPFALMARDLQIIKQYCLVGEEEEKLLCHHASPIVVLPLIQTGNKNEKSAPAAASPENNQGKFAPARTVSPSVAPAQNTLGFMLPYSPLHYLLLQKVQTPIVLTSGNRSDEPQCIDNAEARERLSEIADYFLFHNREIVNRLDDSVVRVMAGKPVYLRRARGYAPRPIPLPAGFEKSPAMVALGGELKSTFCLLKKSKAIISQHMGDLEEARSWADFQKNLGLYKQCFELEPERLAVDLHPEYLSSKFGRKQAQDASLPLDEIQHHHAHIASCLADNGWPLTAGAVLGVALDGLGYGCDGTLWGGEFLLCDYISAQRLGTFKPVAMLGGAQAIREPWRNAYAQLMAQMDWPRFKMDFADLELTAFFESKALDTFNSMLKSKTNSPLSSSCGRLFDAAAAAIGVCRDHASYEGQAALELESIVCPHTLACEDDRLAYPFAIQRPGGEGIPYIDPLPFWQALLADLHLGTPAGVMAARFHKGLAMAIVQMVTTLCPRDKKLQLSAVALSGGVFQNKILLEQVDAGLTGQGFKVLKHKQVPPNDGGLSLGQALIGAAIHLQADKETSHVSWHSRPNS